MPGLVKVWVVLAPQSVDTICLSDHSFDHFWLVMRQIVRNIKHYVADEVPYRRNSLRCDVAEAEMINSWIEFAILTHHRRTPVFKGESSAPVYLIKESALSFIGPLHETYRKNHNSS